MPLAKNPFHQYYEKHRDELLEEIQYMTVRDFCEKYSIWTSLFNSIFSWKKRRVYNRNVDKKTPEELLQIKRNKRLEREEEIKFFNDRIKELADKFITNETHIKNLVNKWYCLSEIEAWHIENWQLIVTDKILYSPL